MLYKSAGHRWQGNDRIGSPTRWLPLIVASGAVNTSRSRLTRVRSIRRSPDKTEPLEYQPNDA